MARTLKSDRFLFSATLFLVCASVIMVYSASAVQAQTKYNQPFFFLFKQLAWAVMGFVLMLIAMRVDYPREVVALGALRDHRRIDGCAGSDYRSAARHDLDPRAGMVRRCGDTEGRSHRARQT